MILDKLTKLEKQENFSKWQGAAGVYIFRHLEQGKAGKRSAGKLPLAQVYCQRKYLSGVFRTEKPFEFSGDLLDESGKKQYIKFVFKSSNEMIIETVDRKKKG